MTSNKVLTEKGEVETFTYTAYTANGDELKLTSSDGSLTAGVYKYNDKNEVGANVPTAQTKILEVNGSVIKLDGFTGDKSYFNVDASIYFAGEQTTLTAGQEIFYTTNTTTGYINNIWVVKDATVAP